MPRHLAPWSPNPALAPYNAPPARYESSGRSIAWVFQRFFGYLVLTIVGALITLFIFEAAYPVHLDQGLRFYELWLAAPSYAEFMAGLKHCGIKDVLVFRLLLLAGVYPLMFAYFVRTEIIYPLLGRRPSERKIPIVALLATWLQCGTLFFAIAGYVTTIDRFTQPPDCSYHYSASF